MRLSLVRFLLPSLILIAAMGLGCQGSIVASLEPEGNLLGINLFEVPSTMAPGQVHMVGARGLYPGTATFNITTYASWGSSDLDVIELLGKGILRAVGGGTAVITASYKGVTQTATIQVSGPPLPPGPPATVLVSIQILPTWAAVRIGESYQFSATAYYSNGTSQPVTTLVDWRVSDDKPGFIIDNDNANAWGPNYGQFRATSVGTTVVSCALAGMVSNYVTVVVRDY